MLGGVRLIINALSRATRPLLTMNATVSLSGVVRLIALSLIVTIPNRHMVLIDSAYRSIILISPSLIASMLTALVCRSASRGYFDGFDEHLLSFHFHPITFLVKTVMLSACT
jgi:hypothetical protein